MTDNPIRRAMQESADMGARLLRAKNQDIANRLAATPGVSFHLGRAITDAVQENEMCVRTFKMTDYERRVASIADAICTPGKREEENEMTEQTMTAAEAEHLVAEACLDAGMVGREVEIIAAIRADERAKPFTYEQVLAARAAYKRRMRSNPASWQSHDAREEDAILEALEAAQAVSADNTGHPEDQEG